LSNEELRVKLLTVDFRRVKAVRSSADQQFLEKAKSQPLAALQVQL
jgi:hypothetical protein